MNVMHVVGARPNFMKVAPVWRALSRRDAVLQTLVHTGQHYDVSMSDVFFQELGLPAPDVNLRVGSGTHAQQTGRIMIEFEPVVVASRPDVVLVYGDVNSTAAASLVCAKVGVKVGHVEAGLRSFDREMPEEINRIVTDQLCDLLFTPSSDGDENLLREGVAPEKIHFVGNVMIDTLLLLLDQARQRLPVLRRELWLERYGLVTLHRPSNVDDSARLKEVIRVLGDVSRDLPLCLPLHPRTRERLKDVPLPSGLKITQPMSYIDFLALQTEATVIITDSGGVQEESTYLQVPCITLRKNTERPVTTSMGTNLLLGEDVTLLGATVRRAVLGEWKRGTVPPLWDGRTSERIADVLTEVFAGTPSSVA